MNNFNRTRDFHIAMGLKVRPHIPGTPAIPSVSERILRGRLLLEEAIETIMDGLGLQATIDGTIIDLRHVELSESETRAYDPVETLDGLADVKVIANGTAVAFGLPMDEADIEVFESNMSKLDENGEPVINRCEWDTDGEGCHHESEEQCELIDPTKPVGKLLKSARYRPANIRRVLGLD